MPRRNKKKFPCRYCERDDFKSPRAVNQHIRQAHKGKPKVEAQPPKPVVVQEPICFCCYCGKMLPNATILPPVPKP